MKRAIKREPDAEIREGTKRSKTVSGEVKAGGPSNARAKKKNIYNLV